MFERFNNHVIVGMLDRLFAISLVFSGFFALEICPQRANHVHIKARNVIVVIANLLILLLVLVLELFDRSVFLGLNLSDLSLSLGFHVLAQPSHFGLVLFLDLAGDTLVLLSFLSRKGIVMLGQSVTVLGLTNLLFLLLHLQCAQVLLQFTLIDPMLILAILELDLGLLLDHGLLVEILEHEMLEPLAPDLDRDRVLLLQVLVLAIFVSQLGLLVLELLLRDEPEIIDSQALIVVLASGHLFLLDQPLKCTALISHSFLILVIVIVINRIGSCQGFLLGVDFLCAAGGWIFLGRHICDNGWGLL